MSFVDWDSRMSVGVRSVDDEHRALVAILNELADAKLAGRGKEVLSAILERLIIHTRIHFAHEERLFAVHTYPGAAKHKAEHAALVEQALAVQARYAAAAQGTLSGAVLAFFRDWLLYHVRSSDQEFGRFLHASGVIVSQLSAQR